MIRGISAVTLERELHFFPRVVATILVLANRGLRVSAGYLTPFPRLPSSFNTLDSILFTTIHKPKTIPVTRDITS